MTYTRSEQQYFHILNRAESCGWHAKLSDGALKLLCVLLDTAKEIGWDEPLFLAAATITRRLKVSAGHVRKLRKELEDKKAINVIRGWAKREGRPAQAPCYVVLYSNICRPYAEVNPTEETQQARDLARDQARDLAHIWSTDRLTKELKRDALLGDGENGHGSDSRIDNAAIVDEVTKDTGHALDPRTQALVDHITQHPDVQLKTPTNIPPAFIEAAQRLWDTGATDDEARKLADKATDAANRDIVTTLNYYPKSRIFETTTISAATKTVGAPKARRKNPRNSLVGVWKKAEQMWAGGGDARLEDVERLAREIGAHVIDYMLTDDGIDTIESLVRQAAKDFHGNVNEGMVRDNMTTWNNWRHGVLRDQAAIDKAEQDQAETTADAPDMEPGSYVEIEYWRPVEGEAPAALDDVEHGEYEELLPEATTVLADDTDTFDDGDRYWPVDDGEIAPEDDDATHVERSLASMPEADASEDDQDETSDDDDPSDPDGVPTDADSALGDEEGALLSATDILGSMGATSMTETRAPWSATRKRPDRKEAGSTSRFGRYSVLSYLDPSVMEEELNAARARADAEMGMTS